MSHEAILAGATAVVIAASLVAVVALPDVIAETYDDPAGPGHLPI